MRRATGKKMLSLLALSAVFFAALTGLMSSQAQADSLPAERLKKVVEMYKSQYPGYVHQSFQRLIAQYFSMRFQDFSQSGIELLRQTQQRELDVKQLGKAWDFASSMVPHISMAERMGVTLYAIRGSAEMQAVHLRAIAADLADVLDAFHEACAEPGLRFANRYFDPEGLFPKIDPRIAAASGTHNIHISVPIDFNGHVTGVNSYASGGDMFDELLVRSTAYLGGQAIGGYEGQLAAALAAGIIMSLRRAAELAQQQEQLDKLEAIINGTIDAESAGSRAAIKATCDALMPQQIGAQLEQMRNYALLAATDSEVLSKRIALEFNLFPKKVADYLRNLSEKFDDLADRAEVDYSNASRDYFDQQLNADAEVRAFMVNVATVPLAVLKKESAETSVVGAQSALWESLIVGDAKFRGPLWNSVHDVLESEIGKDRSAP